MGKERSYLSALSVVDKILNTTVLPVMSYGAKGRCVWFPRVTGLWRGMPERVLYQDWPGPAQEVDASSREKPGMDCCLPSEGVIFREAQKKVWTEEEEALLNQLVVIYAGNRNINRLIVDHILSKMA